jgi:hypothetical protein
VKLAEVELELADVEVVSLTQAHTHTSKGQTLTH